jgi:putative glutamine amidotransferase
VRTIKILSTIFKEVEMKKYIQCLIIFFLLNLYGSYYQITKANDAQEKTTIILVHPHLDVIKSFIYFIENKFIDIPHLEIIGVFYADAVYYYEEVKTFVEENKYPYLHLKLVEGKLDEQELFRNNSLSNIFYELFKTSDGILFLGGADIPPSIYGQKTSFLTDIIYPNRYYFELSLLFHLLGGNQDYSFSPYLDEKPNYIIQGYCLGMQSMNVATGGSLYQDIPSEIYGLKYIEDVLGLDPDERHYPYYFPLKAEEVFWINFHKIQFGPNDYFDKRIKCDTKNNPFVASFHQQSVMNLGKGFEVAATSVDNKVIEAIAHDKFTNVLGLQFHPEIEELYSDDGKRYKFAPSDTSSISYYEFVNNNNSLEFHRAYWKYFSELFLK